jgi:hypothetical protein
MPPDWQFEGIVVVVVVVVTHDTFNVHKQKVLFESPSMPILISVYAFPVHVLVLFA